MRLTARIPVVLALAAGLLAITPAAANATTAKLTAVGHCPTGSTWSSTLTFAAIDVPSGVYGEVKAVSTAAGTFDVAPGNGVKSGSQIILNAWPSHAGNWPGVRTRVGGWTDRFSVVGIPLDVKSFRVMVQYDYTNGHSDDPVVIVKQPEDCEPPWSADSQTQTRNSDAIDCAADTVATTFQRRTRTETSEGVWGPWSAWLNTHTTTRPATDEECPPPVVPPVTPPVEPPTPPVTPPVEPPSCDKLCPVPTKGKGRDLICDGLYDGTYRNVHIPAGATCILSGAQVNGSVVGVGGRDAYILDTTVVRDVRLTRFSGDVVLGNKVGCRYDPRIGGNLTVTNSHNVLACQLTVCGTGTFKGNDGRMTIRSSSFGRHLLVNGNRRFVSDHRNGRPKMQPIRLMNIEVDGRVDTSGNNPRPVLKRRVRIV